MNAIGYEEGMWVRRALGLERSRAVCRNRVAVHSNGSDIKLAQSLADKGVMIRTPRADYGSMKVFSVTPEGARAVGKKLPPDHTPLAH